MRHRIFGRGALRGMGLGLLLSVAPGAMAAPQRVDHERAFEKAACRAQADQTAAERIALDLLKTPEVRQARAEAAQTWRAAVGPVSAEAEALFPEALDELVMDGVMNAVGVTRHPPVIVSIFSLAHQLDGKTVPGSRYGWDNPDVIYGKIAIDPAASYVVTGWMPRRDMQVHLSAVDASAAILRNVSMADLKVEADGSFRFTVSAKPGNLADNHIQISPETASITLRETLGDWAKDRPVYMKVVKSGGVGAGKGGKTLPRIAADHVTMLAGNMARWKPSLYMSLPANTIGQPGYPTDKQGLPNQAMSLANFKLSDDEALIIDVTMGGARYFTIPVYSFWGITGDYRVNTSTFNDRQTARNPDGSMTYVLSPRDPGIHNWLSTNGWHEGDLALRWQELDRQPGVGSGPSVTARLVKLADLPGLLPAYVKRVTPEERAAQIGARQGYPVGLWGGDCAAR